MQRRPLRLAHPRARSNASAHAVSPARAPPFHRACTAARISFTRFLVAAGVEPAPGDPASAGLPSPASAEVAATWQARHGEPPSPRPPPPPPPADDDACAVGGAAFLARDRGNGAALQHQPALLLLEMTDVIDALRGPARVPGWCR